MAKYFPKSTVKVKEASPGNFVYKLTRKPFSGKYIHTSDNKFYAGSNTSRLGPELDKPKVDLGTFGKTREINKYNLLQESTYKELADNKTLFPSKTLPTEKDYEKGYMLRYFITRINQPDTTFEISKKLYDDIVDKDIYDSNLYVVGFLRWVLVGDVQKANYLNIIKQSRKYPKLYGIFQKLDEYYVKPSFHEGGDSPPNIDGRFYPDGMAVPPNLPESYKIPNNAIKHCGNCIFNENNYCTGWKAEIRKIYWCKSWGVNPKTYEDSSVDEFLALTMENYEPPALIPPSLQNNFPPFGFAGKKMGVIRVWRNEQGGDNLRYRWDGSNWIRVTNNPDDLYHPFGEPGSPNREKRKWLEEEGGDGKTYRWTEKTNSWVRLPFQLGGGFLNPN